MSPSAGPSQFCLFLFGAFRLERNGKAIRLSRRKVQALLAYLALEPGPHTREQLAALLWGDTSDHQARTSLRTTLVALHHELGSQIVLAERDTVLLNPDFPLWIDVRAFDESRAQSQACASRPGADRVAIAELQAAIDLYRGELLQEMYDDWVLVVRERYRTFYLDALLQLTQLFRTASEYEHAIDSAHRALAVDPANERAYQHLMFCELAHGDRYAALKIYEQCVRALREELAVEPALETAALGQWLKQAPAAPALAARVTNLPISLTSFVGRQREMAEVKRLLTGSPSGRLLTLTGAGGSGKTRLAIQAATDLIDAFHDGVWWVELVALSDPTLVPQAVAKALGIRESPTQPPVETLVGACKAKQLLLVLDNCEHLVLACARLAETLLTHCPDFQILATSREPLRIPGEQVWTVPLLSVPAAEPSSLAALLLEFEGIRLFVERAGAVRPDFVLDEGNALAIAQICRRLDGIPLAIELAAARVNVLTPGEIAARLDDRFNLLTGGNRTALPRQQTLRALIDWSYELLSEEERVLFRRLAVFSGGRNLEAVEQVCGSVPLDPVRVCDLLGQLVAKSLLVVEEKNGSMRYGFLDTIKAYALAKLGESGEAEQTRRRHLEHFLGLAEEAGHKLSGPEHALWLNCLEVEHNNFRTALLFALAESDHENALRLCIALKPLWEERGYWNEAREWLERTRDQACVRLGAGASESLRSRYAWAQAYSSYFADMLGDYDAARALADESLAQFRVISETGGVAYALARLASLSFNHGAYARAAELWAESVKLWRGLGDRYWVLTLLQQLSMARRRLGDYAGARALLEESLALSREAGDSRGIANALNSLGVVTYHQADYGAAQHFYLEALQVYRAFDDQYSVAGVALNLGNVALARGDPATARASFEESLTIMRKIGDRRMIALLLASIGDIMRRQGDYGPARPLVTESVELQRALGDKRGIALGLKGLALLDLMEENYPSARRGVEEALELARAAGDQEIVPDLLNVTGHIYTAQDELARAQAAFAESLMRARELGSKLEMVNAFIGTAYLAAKTGQSVRGLLLVAAAESLLNTIKGQIDPLNQLWRDRILEVAHSQLDQPGYRQAWEQGRALTLGHAVELVMEQAG